jgi:hypothetical protein
MRGQLFLCTHRYQFVDAMQILKYVWKHKNILSTNNIAVITSSQSANIVSAKLFFKLVYDINLSVVISKRDMSAATQIQSHLENGDTVFVFYEKHRMSSGVWHVLNNLQHNVEINVARIVIRNAPTTTWVPQNVVANLCNDINVIMCDIINNEETVQIEQLPDRVFADVDADAFKHKLGQILYEN